MKYQITIILRGRPEDVPKDIQAEAASIEDVIDFLEQWTTDAGQVVMGSKVLPNDVGIDWPSFFAGIAIDVVEGIKETLTASPVAYHFSHTLGAEVTVSVIE